MHTNETQNYLVIEDLDKFPLPKECSENIKAIDHSKVTWVAFGLPAHNSSFSISGESLYFDSDENDDMRVKKVEFTGEVIAKTAFINPASCGKNFIVLTSLLFFKGILMESNIIEFQVQDFEEYEKIAAEEDVALKKASKRDNSFWFKYLYTPYFYAVKGMSFVMIMPMDLFAKYLCKIVSFILPFRR